MPWQEHWDAAIRAFDDGDLDAAESKFRAALEIAEGPEQRGLVHHHLALTFHRRGRLEDAIASATKAAEISKAEPEILHTLGLLHVEQANWKLALETLNEAMRLSKPPKSSLVLRDIARVLAGIGQTKLALDGYNLALQQLIAAGERDEILETCHEVTTLLVRVGQAAEAEPAARKSLELAESLYGPESPEAALATVRLADVLRAQDRGDEATALVRKAVELEEKRGESDRLAQALTNLGEFERAIAIYTKLHGPDHPGIAQVLDAQAPTLDFEARVHAMMRAVTIRARSLGPDHPEVADTLERLGVELARGGHFAEAERCLREGLSIRERTMPGSFEAARGTAMVAELCEATKRPDEAILLRERAQAAFEKMDGAEEFARAQAEALERLKKGSSHP